jgi:glycosyltransferase involved in cell wall biosynthesis
VRILHLVTLVAGGGSVGGPVSVAREQCIELARRGHEVTLAAGSDGVGDLALDGSGVRERLFRARPLPGGGFGGLLAPGLVRFLHRHAAAEFDLVHVHLGRDLVTQAATGALRHVGVPYVAQTHGMITPDHRPRARTMDALSTRRSLAGAAALLCLDADEAADIVEVAEPAPAWSEPVDERIHLLPDGVGPAALPPHPDRTPHPVADVLFVGRLHPRKRVLLFVETAAALLARGCRMRFSIVGPDHGQLAAARARVRELGLTGAVRYEGPLPPERIADRLAAADVLVVPSAVEPFGMVALEAMAAGTPVVLSDACAIAGRMRALDAAVVRPATPEALADGVLEALRPQRWRDLSDAGRRAVETEFGAAAVVDRLESIYRCAPFPAPVPAP